MNKKEVSALLAQELVNRSPKLKPIYANANGEVVFNAKDEVQVAEVLMKAPAFFSFPASWVHGQLSQGA